jgi:glycine/D-amino acid oxidase-like deaminating enzyme
MSSKDGFSWTESQGLKAGVPCIGAISPPKNLANGNTKFDVIVVGAGYCGLTAARDASIAGAFQTITFHKLHDFSLIIIPGLKVLLVEARDRIGGRSWSSNIEGYPYEMGGTWVYWGQANVWREISRYDMQDELEVTYDFSRGINQYLLVTPEGTQKFTHEEEVSTFWT